MHPWTTKLHKTTTQRESQKTREPARSNSQEFTELNQGITETRSPSHPEFWKASTSRHSLFTVDSCQLGTLPRGEEKKGEEKRQETTKRRWRSIQRDQGQCDGFERFRFFLLAPRGGVLARRSFTIQTLIRASPARSLSLNSAVPAAPKQTVPRVLWLRVKRRLYFAREIVDPRIQFSRNHGKTRSSPEENRQRDATRRFRGTLARESTAALAQRMG